MANTSLECLWDCERELCFVLVGWNYPLWAKQVVLGCKTSFCAVTGSQRGAPSCQALGKPRSLYLEPRAPCSLIPHGHIIVLHKTHCVSVWTICSKLILVWFWEWAVITAPVFLAFEVAGDKDQDLSFEWSICIILVKAVKLSFHKHLLFNLFYKLVFCVNRQWIMTHRCLYHANAGTPWF